VYASSFILIGILGLFVELGYVANIVKKRVSGTSLSVSIETAI
jgi:hypothetical protein